MGTIVRGVLGACALLAVAAGIWLAWDWREQARVPVRLARVDAAVATLPANATPRSKAERTARLASAQSWGYQLQKAEVDELAASRFDVLVIDYSRDGGEEGAFSRAEIARIRAGAPGGRRVVLAYMSIGEAENYRWYWRPEWGRSPPPWLGPENPEWRSNYQARFWHPDWQRIILDARSGYLARVLAAGFDGVYLDRVDIYQEFGRERPAAKAEMLAFVDRFAREARARDPAFLIVPQNAEELLEDDAYRALIDAVAKEDLLFGAYRERRLNPEAEIVEGFERLMQARRDGKAVLVVEYIHNPMHMGLAADVIVKRGFVPHFTGRQLDSLDVHQTPRELWPPQARKRRKPMPSKGAPQT